MALSSAGMQSVGLPRPLGLSSTLGSSAGFQSAGTPRNQGQSFSGPLGFSRTTTPSRTGSRATPRSTAPRGTTVLVTDFSSDVGRKNFGFSHEEMDESAAYYEGQFKLFQRYGEGIMHNPETGAKYVGEFQRDVFHGEGDNTWPDGSRYAGQWRNGQKHGKGRYTSSKGLTYEGQWDNGLRHGRGTQEYANKDMYDGGWWSGLCSGVGTYRFADGSKYEGAWANGRYDGSGMYIGVDGTRERQWYSNGLLTKREVLTRSTSKTPQTCRGMIGGKVALAQTRGDMHRPALLSKPQPSRYLIQRETGGVDLSAPPLSPRPASPEGRGPPLQDKHAPSEPAPQPVLAN